jgi:hypothetical protein
MKLDARHFIAMLNVILLIAVGLSFVLHRHGAWQPPKPLAPALTPMLGDNALAQLDQLNNQTNFIVAQPLFWPSRKPLPAQPQASKGSLEGAQLLGTFADGSTRGAIIRLDPKKNTVIRLVVGEAYQGLVLMKVEPFSVEFSDATGSGSYTLKLEYAKQSDSVVPAPATAKGLEPNAPHP